ncbi:MULTISPECIES: alpha-amylase [Chryseobacterium]|uniref:Alpha-amylase n=1 Tax=Chryseobacterium camelliae TaxID=1265445 RepID=A0ABU0TDC3_9FLAO|nr:MULTISPECIES: alpha-amylase [Chryseobacterium]MDT3407131.1 alpha-amylase [Pseudacidovorax intermedius]MDQ1095077.1 alpha-amylase [Chryseobacterium camelliae]MDQ1099016.1 alpha-amylase [Chryseobacterium sp. SORGH_AS_1048]MDR6086364.1 alpha-amylase [Chryseobacterium sp. SORGH_AS_0909]MDR6130737.1 alpha-amylase [Chryseobacterium sp. SORGH_AS_1175]
MNGVIIQFFHWYHPGNVWNEFSEKAEYLKKLGITAAWLPPAIKCNLGTESRGYDVYDLYDLGEFNQKGTIATRYGSKEDYLKAINKAHKMGIAVYADIVLNHRMGADETEEITVHEVNEEDRTRIIGKPFRAKASTRFTFPGRQGKYSGFIWDHQCFSGIDTLIKNGQKLEGIFKIHNDFKDWNPSASHQFGNYDYLMGADVEYRNPEVIRETKEWIKWYIETTHIDGLRLDALKHISSDFLKDWINYIKTEVKDCFIIGEFWKDDVEKISEFSEKIGPIISCFDVPLHYHFFTASKEGKNYDLRKIFNNTLTEINPETSVTFVENHDTQKFQALESTVKDWFKPLAYALILMSKDGYPCIFYPDLFGAEYPEIQDNKEIRVLIPKITILPMLLEARQKFAYGEQINYFDGPNCIAWVRKGDDRHSGCVVIISSNEECCKEIEMEKEMAGSALYDFLGYRPETIVLNENGKAVFPVNPRSVSIWTFK